MVEKKMAAMSANRQKTDAGGKRPAPATAFKPGLSGNPSGRPKKTEQEFALERACEARSPEALTTILDIMRKSQSDKVRLSAAAFIIERRYGKAVTKTEDVTDPFKKALSGMSAEKAQAMLDAMEQVKMIQNKVIVVNHQGCPRHAEAPVNVLDNLIEQEGIKQ